MSTSIVPFEPALQLSRQALYRYLSLAFLDPRYGAWQSLSDRALQQCVKAGAEWLRDEGAAQPRQLGLGEYGLEALDPSALLKRLPRSQEALNAEFESTFGLLVAGTCPPYETEYLSEKFTFQRSQHLADIGGFYRAFGLQPYSERPERQDHIVLELEFMASVVGLERKAAETGDPERVAICRSAQARFMKEHLAWWIPTFARLLSLEADDGFHAAAGKLLAAFLPAERSLLNVPAPSMSAGPSHIERPEECAGCLVQI